ncbi:MAG: hypothetical protein ABIJ97_04260 [Bacteroidota bacterium]
MKKLKIILLLSICSLHLAFYNLQAQNIGINSTGAAPNASALLDLDASPDYNKGLLIPRLTTTQRDAISNPAEALLIFNTDTKCVNIYKSGAWWELCGICTPMPSTANAGTDQLNISGTSTTLTGNAPTYGIGTWSIISGTGGNITTPTSPTSTFTGTASTSYTLQWTITNPCGSSSDEVEISFATACTGTLQWTQTNDPSVGSDMAAAITLDATGIYVAGSDNVPGNSEWRIEKRDLSTGATIWTQTNNPSTGGDAAQAITVDATGIYIGGSDNTPGGSDSQWRIEKRNLSTGAIIWTQTSNPTIGGDQIYAITVDATAVYVAGIDWSAGGSNGEWRIEKRNSTTGALIWFQTEDFSVGMDMIQGIAVDATGIYVAGEMRDPTMNIGWQVEKRDLSSGAITWTQQYNPSGEDMAYAVALDATGIYITGYDCQSGGCQIRIEKRDLSDGSLIWLENSDPSVGYDIGCAIAVDGTGIYLGGRDNTPGNPEWRIESRSLSGSLNWGVSNNPSSGWEFATGVAVDATGFYIVGWDAIGGGQWHIEKRCK